MVVNLNGLGNGVSYPLPAFTRDFKKKRPVPKCQTASGVFDYLDDSALRILDQFNGEGPQTPFRKSRMSGRRSRELGSPIISSNPWRAP